MSAANLVFRLDLQGPEAALSTFGYDNKTTYTAYAFKPGTASFEDPEQVLCKINDVPEATLPDAESSLEETYRTWMIGLDLVQDQDTMTRGLLSFSRFLSLTGLGFHPAHWANPVFTASYVNPSEYPAIAGTADPATSYGYGPKLSLGAWQTELEVRQGRIVLESDQQELGRLIILGLEDYPGVQPYIFSLAGEQPSFYRLNSKDQLVYFPAYLLFAASPRSELPEHIPLRISLVTVHGPGK